MERQDNIIRRAMHNLDRMADDSRLEAEAVGDGIGQGRSIGGLEPERLISEASAQFGWAAFGDDTAFIDDGDPITLDRKSTRLNSSHVAISYAVFCLKKKMNIVAKHTK